MLGGYGKPMAIMMAMMIVPVYAGLIAGLAFPRYMLYSIVGGVGGSILLLMLLTTWKNSRFMGLRALGLTRRLPGGEDDFSYIVFEKEYELPREGGKYVYAIRDSLTRDWYIFLMDHPFGELLHRKDEILAGSWIVPLPTSYVDGVQLKRVERQLSELQIERGLLERILRREKDRVLDIPVIYAHSTNKTAEQIFAGKPAAGDPPPKEALVNAYADFTLIDPDYAKLTASDEGKSQLLKRQEEVILSLGKESVKYNQPKAEESPPSVNWRLLLYVLAGAAAFFLAAYAGRVLGWW